MPRKYKANSMDYFFLSGITSVYGMLRPIEEKIKAGGYKGIILADFNNKIYEDEEVVDEEATRKKQEEADREINGKAPKVMPVFKKSSYDFLKNMMDAELEDEGSFFVDANISVREVLTKNQENKFRKYINKYEKYIDLLIKNTPEEEYKEELDELKLNKAYIRMINVFGSRDLIYDRLGFLTSIKGYDADRNQIKEVGKVNDKCISRELWKAEQRNYPYSRVRNAGVELINLQCDYEEKKVKDTYVEQLRFREKYKKALQEWIDAYYDTALNKTEFEKRLRNRAKKIVLSNLKENDKKNNKTIDYDAILKRVEEKRKKGEAVDPADEAIVDDIKTKIDAYYNRNYEKSDALYSRYGVELYEMGCATPGEKNFTGDRGSASYIHEVEAQINAIEMGWPMDELVHIQRLQIAMRKQFVAIGRVLSQEDLEFKKSIKTFYDEKIKDKPYPATEEERRALYQELYKIGRGIVKLTKAHYKNPNDLDESVKLQWDELSNDIRKSMNKTLSAVEQLVVRHYVSDVAPAVSQKSIDEIDTKLSKKRLGHGNSTEYDNLQKAFNKLKEAFGANKNEFIKFRKNDISAQNLKLLEELRTCAAAYLNEKDKDNKLPKDRSDMGKDRYEGAQKAYHFADMILNSQAARREAVAAEKKKRQLAKARREMKEVFSNSRKPLSDEDIKQQEADIKENPETDEDEYYKFIYSCKIKKTAPIREDEEIPDKELQQRRVDDLSNMLAAMEYEEAGKAFDLKEISKRALEIKTVYALDALKLSSSAINGPEKLRNALMATFRAKDLKKELETGIYGVGKAGSKSYAESQIKYKKDITELAGRKIPSDADQYTGDISDALNNIKNINLEDKTLVGINSYKLRKANVKLMEAIVRFVNKSRTIDMDSFGTKLAFDSIAVLNSYTGCRVVTNKLLQRMNTYSKDLTGKKVNIDIADFDKNYGIKHSKEMNINRKKNATVDEKIEDAFKNFDLRNEKEHIKAIDDLFGMKPVLNEYFDTNANKLNKRRKDGTTPMDDLKPINNKFKAIGAVNSDESLSNEEFSAMVFVSLITRDEVEKARQEDGEPEKMRSMLNKEQYYNNSITCYLEKITTDLNEKIEKYVPAIERCRGKVKDVFSRYNDGDKKPLAHMLAQGIKDLVTAEKTNLYERANTDYVCFAETAKRLYSMAKKDPQLMKLALEEGLNKEDILFIVNKGETTSHIIETKNKFHYAVNNYDKLSPKEKEDIYTDVFISAMYTDEKWKSTYYGIEYDKAYIKESESIYKKFYRKYLTEEMGIELAKDFNGVVLQFPDFPKHSIDSYKDAMEECDKIENIEDKNKAKKQMKTAFSNELKDYFIEKYTFSDNYEKDILEKYKKVMDKNKIKTEDRLEFAVKAEKDRLEGRANLPEKDKNDFLRLDKYRKFMHGIAGLSKSVGPFVGAKNVVAKSLEPKYYKENMVTEMIYDKDKLKELREDVRSYIRDKKLTDKIPREYVKELETYNYFLVRRNEHPEQELTEDDVTLYDRLEFHKETKMEAKNKAPAKDKATVPNAH